MMDNGIIKAMFERILNTFTVIFLDLTPKINETINPMFIKTYREIGIHRFILGDLKTKKVNTATKNKIKVKMIGKNSLCCLKILPPLISYVLILSKNVILLKISLWFNEV